MIASIEALVSSDARYHVWVVSYSISMGRNMWLAVHDGSFVERTELLAKGCTFWRGPLEAGPWRLVLEPLGGAASGTVRFADRDGGFELICESLQVAAPERIKIG